jgi:plasmid maintenance system killer protein
MKVGFCDSRTQRLFNDHERLEARYGAEVAIRVATRMEMLVIAKNLSVLPTRPPIGFQAIGDQTDQFSVDLGAPYCLRFVGLDGRVWRGKADKLRHIEVIEVIGVE